ncbi:MAG: hypothetical protein GY821_12520 [Gammaproteobacteria bacterium]|nr:hypothetical protein [Gammaproteobacteria bacterium]
MFVVGVECKIFTEKEMGISWQPLKTDIKQICNTILECCVDEDKDSCDYCIFCGTEQIPREGESLKHSKDCIVLIAKDVLTGIGG